MNWILFRLLSIVMILALGEVGIALAQNAITSTAPNLATSSAPITNVVSLQTVVQAIAGSAPTVSSIVLTGQVTIPNSQGKTTVPISITVNADGSTTSYIQDSSGTRTESYPASNAINNCPAASQETSPANSRGAGSQETSVNGSSADYCWNSASWIMPTLALKASKIVAGLSASSSNIQRDGQSFIIVKLSLSNAKLPTFIQSYIAQRSERDVYLDPTSLLPQKLIYHIPSKDPRLDLGTFEFSYSDYRLVSGVNIPFHIQKIFQKTVISDISLQAAQVNP
jgi:hypothetical protein